MTREELAARITQLREGKGESQTELGDALGVTQQAVSDWEGGAVPRWDTLIKLAAHFGVSLSGLTEPREETRKAG